MEIKPGDIISIRHYSGINPLRSLVAASHDENIRVKLTKDFAIMNFLVGDPVVLGFESGNKVYIVGSNIVEIDVKSNTVVLETDKIESEAQKRQYKRYPVSFYADIRTRESKKKTLATIKDISYFGMLIFAAEEFYINQEIQLDIYMEHNIVFIKAAIVRKIKKNNKFEYGLRLIYMDHNSMLFMRAYLDRLEEIQIDYIKKLKDI